MIVLDASAVVELLTEGSLAGAIDAALRANRVKQIVPHLLDVEVASALRGMVAGNRLDAQQAAASLAGLNRLPAERHPHLHLLPRVWELRHNFTSYDAIYIALAEANDAALFTCDPKLRKGHRANVVVFQAT